MAPRDKDDKKKIVIVKKSGGHHGGHHGGSWKVAFADFMTAMMALFLVLWVVGMTDSKGKAEIEGYFQNPRGFHDKPGAGAQPVGAAAKADPAAIAAILRAARNMERRSFERIASRLKTIVLESKDLKGLGAQIEVTVGPEGLRIELVDAGGGKDFFPRGSAQMQDVTQAAMRLIAAELRAIPNTMVIEGHTDGASYSTVTGYTNWELSADRANAARRALMVHGLPDARLSEVRGYADRVPRVKDDPLAARNRRISILVPYSAQYDVQALLRRRVVKSALGDEIFADTEPLPPPPSPTNVRRAAPASPTDDAPDAGAHPDTTATATRRPSALGRVVATGRSGGAAAPDAASAGRGARPRSRPPARPARDTVRRAPRSAPATTPASRRAADAAADLRGDTP